MDLGKGELEGDPGAPGDPGDPGDPLSLPADPDEGALRWLCAVAPYPVIIADCGGIILHASEKACKLFGYEAAQLVGQAVELLIPDALRQSHEAHRTAYMQSPRERLMGAGRDLPGLDSYGRSIPLEIALVPLTLSGEPAVMVTMIDLSIRRQLEDRLREERDFSAAIIDGLPAVFYLLDTQGRFLRWNRNFETVTGLPSDEISRIEAMDLFKDEERQRIQEAIATVFREGRNNIEADFRTRGGAYTPYYFSGLRVKLSGELCLAGSGIDISALKTLQARLELQATHDPLTGLANRQRFESLLSQEMERVKRYGSMFSLIMFDIDHFKAVNDDYGHPVGDLILRKFGETLSPHVRSTDTLARWGGEEFMLLLPGTPLDHASAVAESVRQRIGAAMIPGLRKVTISGGVTQYRPNEAASVLLKRVDDALYEAKSTGRDCVVNR